MRESTGCTLTDEELEEHSFIGGDPELAESHAAMLVDAIAERIRIGNTPTCEDTTCPECGFNCGDTWENNGMAEDGVCRECGYSFRDSGGAA